jgi:hypothetical protein
VADVRATVSPHQLYCFILQHTPARAGVPFQSNQSALSAKQSSMTSLHASYTSCMPPVRRARRRLCYWLCAAAVITPCNCQLNCNLFGGGESKHVAV